MENTTETQSATNTTEKVSAPNATKNAQANSTQTNEEQPKQDQKKRFERPTRARNGKKIPTSGKGWVSDFKKSFDIIILNDGPMDCVNELLKKIIGCKK